MSALDDILLVALEVLAIVTVVVALAWFAERLLVRQRPALRASLWLVTLVGVLLTPPFVLLGRQLPWRVAVLLPAEATITQPGPRRPPALPDPPRSNGTTEGTPAPPSSLAAPVVARSGAAPASTPLTGERSEAPPGATLDPEPTSEVAARLPTLDVPPTTVVLTVWCLGSAYLACRLLHGSLRVRRLWRRLRPLDGATWTDELQACGRLLSLSRLPAIDLSPDVRSPLVAGLFPPRVILPERLPENSTREQFLAVLVHECAHVVRRDPWVRLLQRLATLLFWVHPLVHLLNRRLDLAREEVCDNHALACIDAPTYAETLLTLARWCYPTPRLEGYLTMLPRHYPLERRVTALLEEGRDTRTSLRPRQWAALLTCLGLLLAVASSVGVTASPTEDTPAKADEPSEKVAGEKLAGQVLLADGKPAAGAIVWAAQFDHGPLVRRETVADDQGRYTLPLSPGKWWVWARRGTQGGEGQGPSDTVDIVAGRTPRQITIRLEERGKFRGRLLEAESGKPIPGGKLYLDSAIVLTTDANGKFEVGGLTRTNHESFVVAPGRMRLRVLFDTTGEADTELDVPVPRGGKIVGRVTDLDGKPIPGAHVGRSTSGSYFSINALYVACDKEGRFEYDDAVSVDQPTRLTAGAPGYVADEQRGTASAGKPLEMNFRLRPKPGTASAARVPDSEKLRAVSGVVTGPNGKAVAGVLIRWGYQPYSDAKETRTDDAGRFRFLVPDKENLLGVLPKGYTPEFPRVVAGGDQEVKVKLREGRMALGRVVDDRGKPIPDVTVIAVVPSPDPRIGNPYWLSEAAVRTNAEGKFTLLGVPDNARFDFMKRGLGDVRDRELDVTRTDNSVVMVFRGALSGRVVDKDGKPVRNFRVLVNFPRERKEGDATTGFFAGYTGMGVRFTSADGSFVLTGVGAGSVYRVTALADGHGEATVDRMVAMPSNHVRNAKPTTLKAGPTVKLRVLATTSDRKPIPDARVTLVNGQPGLDQRFAWGYHDAGWEDMNRGRTGADGWADFPALAFGEATVLVRAPGYARHRVGWRKKEKDLTCELPKEAVLTGEVRDADGKPVKECYVQLAGDRGDQVVASVGAEDKGRFRITELPAGTWEVVIRASDSPSVLHQQKVKVEAGETKELKITTKKP